MRSDWIRHQYAVGGVCQASGRCGFISQTFLSLQSAPTNFNPNKQCWTFLSSFPCSSNWKQTAVWSCQLLMFVRVAAHACTCVCTCVCLWVTYLDTITSTPVQPLHSPVFVCLFLGGGCWAEVFPRPFKCFPKVKRFNKSVSCEGEESLFPYPHLEILHLPPENTGCCEAAHRGGKKWVTGCIWSSQRGRTLHLTALLSEPTLNHRTIALCHLELWHTLITASSWQQRQEAKQYLGVHCANSSPNWTCGHKETVTAEVWFQNILLTRSNTSWEPFPPTFKAVDLFFSSSLIISQAWWRHGNWLKKKKQTSLSASSCIF